MPKPSHAKLIAYTLGVAGIVAELAAFVALGAHAPRDRQIARQPHEAASPAVIVAPRILIRSPEVSL